MAVLALFFRFLGRAGDAKRSFVFRTSKFDGLYEDTVKPILEKMAKEEKDKFEAAPDEFFRCKDCHKAHRIPYDIPCELMGSHTIFHVS